LINEENKNGVFKIIKIETSSIMDFDHIISNDVW